MLKKLRAKWLVDKKEDKFIQKDIYDGMYLVGQIIKKENNNRRSNVGKCNGCRRRKNTEKAAKIG